MKIFVLGDTHADWSSLNTFISKKQPDIILICGDFGYWPNEKEFDMKKIKPHNTKIYWCDGNHEDHWNLAKRENNEIVPNVIYVPRGNIINIDGKNIMFFGGAESIDQMVRTLGYDWFPEEIITQKDIMDLPNIKVDVVISHTCPDEFKFKINYKENYGKNSDPSRKALSYVLHRYHPKLWYFGHFHQFVTGEFEGTKWFGLNTITQGCGYGGRSWIELEK